LTYIFIDKESLFAKVLSQLIGNVLTAWVDSGTNAGLSKPPEASQRRQDNLDMHLRKQFEWRKKAPAKVPWPLRESAEAHQRKETWMGSISRQRSPHETDATASRYSDEWAPTPLPSGHAPGIEDLLRTPLNLPSGDDGLRAVLLAKAVEYEIIPRLMLAHRVPEECASHPLTARQSVTPEDVAVFAELVLHEDDRAVRDCVIALRDRGVPIEAIFLDLLSPVARHLGEMWERDLCTFTEVTVGLGRLQKVLRENSAAFGQFNHVGRSEQGRRILLLPCPGEQHTFGLSLVAELFHRAGWDVVTCFLATDAAAVMVQKDWYDVVGFSLGSESGVAKLRAAMALVRQVSQNPQVSIIAGGPIFLLHPEYGEQIQADAIITEGVHAPSQAEQLVAASRLQK
jgi:methanogenic corrinoid protein MtbC1